MVLFNPAPSENRVALFGKTEKRAGRRDLIDTLFVLIYLRNGVIP